MMSDKPLGRKAYGSIPHLIGSRVGEGDHHVHAGQHRICTEKVRNKHDRVLVTEKWDGCNVAIARLGQEVFALTRSGRLARDSRFRHHHMFADWVQTNLRRLSHAVGSGEVLHGEWLALAHGTMYDLERGDDPIVFFDMSEQSGRRFPYAQLIATCLNIGLHMPRVLSDGPAFPVHAALESLTSKVNSALTAGEQPEGAVWRVESSGKFDFMAKFVRQGKVDGRYLPEVSGKEAIWNWQPSKRLVFAR